MKNPTSNRAMPVASQIHTPTPWRSLPPIGPGCYAILSEKVNAHGNFYVATIPEGHPDAEAIAALIVRAVNSHAALVAFVARVSRTIEGGPHATAALAAIKQDALALLSGSTALAPDLNHALNREIDRRDSKAPFPQ